MTPRTSPDRRTRRALTEYMAVLDDVGDDVRDHADRYLVVSQSGAAYVVDLAADTCECPDATHRGNDCKHLRRARFATGDDTVTPDELLAVDPDPQLGLHVDGGLQVAATDGGRFETDDDDADAALPDITTHRESLEQGGEAYVRCEGCGRELLEALGGREKLVHRDDCPHAATEA